LYLRYGQNILNLGLTVRLPCRTVVNVSFSKLLYNHPDKYK
jgi:hypothetical protein